MGVVSSAHHIPAPDSGTKPEKLRYYYTAFFAESQ
jgi:hypothetical protein